MRFVSKKIFLRQIFCTYIVLLPEERRLLRWWALIDEGRYECLVSHFESPGQHALAPGSTPLGTPGDTCCDWRAGLLWWDDGTDIAVQHEWISLWLNPTTVDKVM
jgi:hypothetical protein